MRRIGPAPLTADKSWFDYLSEHCEASTGWGGSLTGMKKQFWGQDCYAVSCCKHWFKVSRQVYNEVLFNVRR